MNDRALDWTLLQSFAAVAEAGSLSAAARATGVSQPTLGRHIRRLEDAAGGALFARHRGGLRLTEAGRRLLPAVAQMRAAAARAALAAAGQGDALAGTVRVTASVAVARYHLPAMLARLRAAAPGLQLEVVASDTSENLLFREADIAIRMYRPGQLDMVARRIGDLTLGLYASHAYLDRLGLPGPPTALGQVEMIGYDRSELIVRGMRALGHDVARGDFPLRCDDQGAYVEMVRAGCGVGIVQDSIAAGMPELVRVFHEVSLPRLPVWLAVPAPLREVRRVRFVLDRLAAELAPLTVPA